MTRTNMKAAFLLTVFVLGNCDNVINFLVNLLPF